MFTGRWGLNRGELISAGVGSFILSVLNLSSKGKNQSDNKTSQTITHPENCVVRRSIDIIGEIVERFFFLAVVLFYLKIKLSLYLTGRQKRSESTESKEEYSKKNLPRTHAERFTLGLD